MRWLGYLWNVLVNCFYLAIVLWVFDKLGNRPEAIVVAVIGMTYVAIRTIAIGQYAITVGSLFVLKKEILRGVPRALGFRGPGRWQYGLPGAA
jgi:hypothetical protein